MRKTCSIEGADSTVPGQGCVTVGMYYQSRTWVRVSVVPAIRSTQRNPCGFAIARCLPAHQCAVSRPTHGVYRILRRGPGVTQDCCLGGCTAVPVDRD